MTNFNSPISKTINIILNNNKLNQQITNMFVSRFLGKSQTATRFSNTIAKSVLAAPSRSYYKDNVLMPREQGEYYADPMDVAERVVRLVALHDNCSDPAQVSLNQSFGACGLNALDMCEVFIGCEREFDLEISEEDCEAMETVNDLVEFLARHPSTK